MRRSSRAVALGGLLVLAPLPSLAQVPAQVVPLPADSSASDRTLAVQVVGGLQGFTAGLSAGTAVGPLLGVAMLWRPFFLLGVELRYEGGRLPFDDVRLPASEALWSHTALGLVKLGLPVTDALSPFVGTGLGVGYLQPSRGARDLYARDILVELPWVLGVEAHAGRLSGGAHVSYRSVLGESFDRTGLGDASGGRVTVGLSLGARF